MPRGSGFTEAARLGDESWASGAVQTLSMSSDGGAGEAGGWPASTSEKGSPCVGLEEAVP